MSSMTLTRSNAPSSNVSAESVEAERIEERRTVAACRHGDARAFRVLVERHHRGLFALAYRMVGDRGDADDLVQESFAKAHRGLDDYDETYRFSTWIYRITLNVCRDFLKSPRRRERPGAIEAALDTAIEAGGEPPDSADVALSRAATIVRVRAAIAQLSDAYREVIVLKDLQDLSYEEIHAITGDPVTALKIRAVRARLRLRALLEGSDP